MLRVEIIHSISGIKVVNDVSIVDDELLFEALCNLSKKTGFVRILSKYTSNP